MIKALGKIFIKNYQDTKDPTVANAYGRLAGIVGIIVNLALSASKILVGFFAGSVSIMGDGINNLSDAGSSIVTVVGFKLAGLPADAEHPFGHQRIEYVSGLIVSFLVLAIGLILGYESVKGIIEPKDVTYGWVALVILAGSILMKVFLYAFYRSGARLIDSTTLKASALDSLADCLSTGVVLISVVVSRLTSWQVDGWMGLVVALFIVYQGIGLIKDTISPLLGEAPSPDYVRHLSDAILKNHPQIIGIHDLVIHTYGPGQVFMTVHLEFDARDDFVSCHDLADVIEHEFLVNEKVHLTTHLDPVDLTEATLELKARVTDVIKAYDPVLKFHDFRTVPGPTHTNLIFDVVVPPRYKKTPDQVKADLRARIRDLDPHYNCVIDIDEEYETF